MAGTLLGPRSIPYLPEGFNWPDWNGNMILLFGEENLPYVPERDWTELADAFAQSPSFSSYGIPATATFPDWRAWASHLIVLVNGTAQ